MAAISSGPRRTSRRWPRAIRAIQRPSCFRRAPTSGGPPPAIPRRSSCGASTRSSTSRWRVRRRRTSGARPRWATGRGNARRTGIPSAPPRMRRRCATSTAACSPRIRRARTAISDSASTTTVSRGRERWLGFLRALSAWGAAMPSEESGTCVAPPMTAISRAWRARGSSRPRSCVRPRAIPPAAPCWNKKRAAMSRD